MRAHLLKMCPDLDLAYWLQITCVVAIISTPLIHVGPVKAESEAEIAYQEAKKAIEQDELESARKLLVTASQTDDKNPDVFLLLGKTEYQLGNIEAAIAAWKTTLKFAPNQAYAKRMIEALSGHNIDNDVRLEIVRGLLSDGLLAAAKQDLSQLGSDRTLTDAQRLELLLLETDYAIQTDNGEAALNHLQEIAVRYPEQLTQLRTQLLTGRANLAADHDLSMRGVAQLQQIVEDHADTSEAIIASLELTLHQLTQDGTAIGDLVSWIEANSDHASSGIARRQLVAALDLLLKTNQASFNSTETSIGPLEGVAISSLESIFPLLKTESERTALIASVLLHVEKRFIKGKIYPAALQTIEGLEKLALNTANQRLVQRSKIQIESAMASDELEKIRFEISAGSVSTTQLEAWIAANGEQTQIGSARTLLVTTYLTAAKQLGATVENATLNKFDFAALEATATAVKTLKQPKDVLSLVKSVSDDLKRRYMKGDSFEAFEEAIKRLQAMELPTGSQVIVQQMSKEKQLAEAAYEYQQIIREAAEGTDIIPLLVDWLASHPTHTDVNKARILLRDTHLGNANQLPVTAKNLTVNEHETRALEVVKLLLDDSKTSADALQLMKKMSTHFGNRYTSKKAYAAGIDGLQKLLALAPPESSQLFLLNALAGDLVNLSIDSITKEITAGRSLGKEMPQPIRDLLLTLSRIRAMDPTSSVWVTQANLGKQLNELAAKIAWPDRTIAPKVAHQWAHELSAPILKSSDTQARDIAIQTIQGIVQQYSDHAEKSANLLATKLHQVLLDRVPVDATQRLAIVLHHIDLLTADSNRIFSDNIRLATPLENEKLNAPQEQAIALLRQIVIEQPAQATVANGKLNQLLANWLAQGMDSVVELAYLDFAKTLPTIQQRELKLALVQLWIAQVVKDRQTTTNSGIEIKRELNPRHEKALQICYELERGLDESHADVSSARNFRSVIIKSYQDLRFYDIAELAIHVQTEPNIDSADAYSELFSANQNLLIAQEELNWILMQHGGVDRIEISDAFKKSIEAYQKIITDRTQSQLVGTAVERLFFIGRIFENQSKHRLAASIFSDIEKFASTVEVLSQRTSADLNVAEQAALASARALHTHANSELSKRIDKASEVDKEISTLSDEHKAALQAYRNIFDQHGEGSARRIAVEQIKLIGLEFAHRSAWDVADEVYASLLDKTLALSQPEKIEFARALCQLGKIMPEHARQVLVALKQTTRPSRDPNSNGTDSQLAGVIGRNFGLFGGGGFGDAIGGGGMSFSGPKPFNESSLAGDPAIADAFKSKISKAEEFAELAKDIPADELLQIQSQLQSVELADKESAQRESVLLAAVRRQQTTLAQQVAMLRDDDLVQNLPAQTAAQQPAAANQQAGQVSMGVPVTVLSDAELKRRKQVIATTYSELQSIMERFPRTATSIQARAEIMVLIGHWRGIAKWDLAAELGKEFLSDQPRDSEVPQLRNAIAGDLLSWATQGYEKNQSKQEILDSISLRFTRVRQELQEIIKDFPEDQSMLQNAQWEIANSFLRQARVVAQWSPTLARGQFVRSADELLQVANMYHDHPKIATIPDMLWGIANELTTRGYFDEAITVWNELTINYPMHRLAYQSALHIAQTYQSRLKQPLRAVETYLELNFARGGQDAPLQQTILEIATQLKSEKRWVEALHVLETFEDSFPQHANAGQVLTMIGQIHQTNEVWQDAIDAYQRVIDDYNGGQWSMEARWSIAECTINLSQWEEAIYAYREFKRLFPKDTRIATADTRILVLKDLARYQRVVDEEGQRKAFDAQFQIAAIVRSQLGNSPKAIEEYNKVAQLWSKSHLADDAYHQIGLIYLEKGETEKARTALLALATQYPASPLADDALFLVGTSYENESRKYSTVSRTESIRDSNDESQRLAYSQSQLNRKNTRARGQEIVTELRRQGKLDEADNATANQAAFNKSFDYANALLIANWAGQHAEEMTAQQMADRQDKINASLRRAVASFEQAAAVLSGDKADDALLRMASIYDTQLNDPEAAKKTWLEIVNQFGGTAVAEDASWKIAYYHEQNGQHDEAIAAFESYLRNYRSSTKAGEAQVSIAENHEQLGNWVNAMDAYTSYLNKFPEGPLVERAKEQVAWIKTYRL